MEPRAKPRACAQKITPRSVERKDLPYGELQSCWLLEMFYGVLHLLNRCRTRMSRDKKS